MCGSTEAHQFPAKLEPDLESDPKYRCCCSSVHVKTGSLFFGLINTFIGVLDLVLIFIFSGGVKTNYAAVAFSFNILFLCGLYRGNSKLIFPYLVQGVVSLGVSFVSELSTFLIFSYKHIMRESPSKATLENSDVHQNSTMPMVYVQEAVMMQYTILIGYVVGVTAVLLLRLWSTSVTYRCYNYINDVEKSHRSAAVKNASQKQETV